MNNTAGPSHSQVLKKVNISVLTENHMVITQDREKQKDEAVNGSKLFIEQIVNGDAQESSEEECKEVFVMKISLILQNQHPKYVMM